MALYLASLERAARAAAGDAVAGARPGDRRRAGEAARVLAHRPMREDRVLAALDRASPRRWHELVPDAYARHAARAVAARGALACARTSTSSCERAGARDG